MAIGDQHRFSLSVIELLITSCTVLPFVVRGATNLEMSDPAVIVPYGILLLVIIAPICFFMEMVSVTYQYLSHVIRGSLAT